MPGHWWPMVQTVPRVGDRPVGVVLPELVLRGAVLLRQVVAEVLPVVVIRWVLCLLAGRRARQLSTRGRTAIDG